MQESSKDRRTAQRVPMQLPLLVRFSNGTVHEEQTFTRDVSFSGVYFYMDGETGGQKQVEITLTLPSEGGEGGVQVRYSGRVARLEPSTDGRLGVAAILANCDSLARA